MKLLETAVLECVGKINGEIARFHPADRVHVMKALLRNKDFVALMRKAKPGEQ